MGSVLVETFAVVVAVVPLILVLLGEDVNESILCLLLLCATGRLTKVDPVISISSLSSFDDACS